MIRIFVSEHVQQRVGSRRGLRIGRWGMGWWVWAHYARCEVVGRVGFLFPSHNIVYDQSFGYNVVHSGRIVAILGWIELVVHVHGTTRTMDRDVGVVLYSSPLGVC